MSLVRERGNVINYRIPITGNLKDPKFHLRDVVTDLLMNVFVKPPTISYGLEVKSAEKGIAELLTVTWKVHQFKLEPEQRKFVGKIARFLKKYPESSIDIYPQQYVSKEKEHILYFEARKKYYLLKNKKSEKEFNDEDSINTERMSVKDLGHYFTKDLMKITRDTTMLTIADKCRHFLGSDIVEVKYNKLIKARENELSSFFTENLTFSRIRIQHNKNTIPYDGFSCHQIKYNGKIPPSLQESYEKMQMLNTKIFRKKYFNR
jgi:hypothetical protein